MADWVTISSLATATGTLVLATATFASVRSGNRTARAAERSLQVGLRPLLIPSRLDDPLQKVMFIDDHWVRLSGGMGAAEVADGVIYLAMALRNSGNGIAVLDRWMFYRGRSTDLTQPADTSGFRRLTRDLYIPADGVGFWQGAIRDPRGPVLARIVRRDRGTPPDHDRPVVRRLRRRPAHDQPVRAHPARRRAVAGADLPPLEPRSGRPAVSSRSPEMRD